MSRKVFPGKQTGVFFKGLRLPDSPPTPPSCAGTCLPSQILNKTRQIKGIPYVRPAFSCCRCLCINIRSCSAKKSGRQSKKKKRGGPDSLSLSVSFFHPFCSVKRKDFANMTRLVDLTLSRNTISYITPYAFADLENLRALHLNRWEDGGGAK